MSARFSLSLRLFFTTCLCLCVCLAAGCSGKQVHVTVENEFNMMAKRLAPVLKAHGVIDEHGAYVAPVFSTPELPPQLGEYLFQRLSPAFRFKVDPALLAHFMSHPFFDRPVPRSGWSQDYNHAYIASVIEKFPRLAKEDFLATACAFTASAIVRSMKENVPEEIIAQTRVIYASGGGVRNPQIMKQLQARLPENIRLAVSDEIGIPAAYKEAVKFATLAYSTIHCIPGNIPAAGHASQYAILGKIALAPRNIPERLLR